MHLDIGLLPSYSLQKMVLVDESNYEGVDTGTISMEITPPGFNKINVQFVPNSYNLYDSVSLGISCGTFTNIPDGIYKVKYHVPKINQFTEKTFLRTELISCKYGKVLLSLHMEDECYDKSKFSKIRDIRQMIDAAISAANNCQTELAYNLYNKADNLLNQIKECDCGM